MRQQRLLIVDDELDMLKGLKRALSFDLKGVEILTTPEAREALEIVRTEPIDVVLMDIRMPQMNGLELLERMLAIDQWLTVIMMTAYGSIETAVEAMKGGAYDFVTKPFDTEVLLRALRKGMERNGLIRENVSLQQRVCERAAFESFVGKAPAMRRLYSTIQAIARAHYGVLIRGESGTGKELVARAIHELSPRRSRSLVTINCPAIPEHLLESELFGHKKGAFTGADAHQVGLFDEADGSSLLLDEIGDIPVSVQTKLLRVLQEQEVKPLGSNKPHKVNVRIIASTNQDLEQKIRDRSFREDLFYRLNVVTIWTPTLDEMREDIPLLMNHFARLACCELGIALKQFSKEALEICMKQPWPGNVRELQNFVRRAVMFCPDDVIRTEDLCFGREPVKSTAFLSAANAASSDASGLCSDEIESPGEIKPYKEAKEQILNRFTLRYVSDLLKKTRGNITRAAELSGLSRVALQKILRRLEFQPRSLDQD